MNNWKAKAGSLLMAIAIWYLIKSHVEQVPKGRNKYPIPGKNAGDMSLAPPGGIRAVTPRIA